MLSLLSLAEIPLSTKFIVAYTWPSRDVETYPDDIVPVENPPSIATISVFPDGTLHL